MLKNIQRNFIAWYLGGGCDGEQKEAALAAFVSPDENDWRFSFIKMDYSLVENKKGLAKIIEQVSPAKRWSFLVGSNERSHTAQTQLIDILGADEVNISLAQLEEAFNIEKVTKEFFNKYRDLFFQTKEALDEILLKDNKIKSDFEEKNIDTSDFTKKLLGQIVFLYFLQKKGWFGVERDADWGTGPKNFLRELQKSKHGKYNNFFNDILEPLFYEALRIDRSANDDYYDKFNCKIPFLNGGLFDPIGEYDWVHTDINLPNDIFSNFNKTKEGDIGTGVLDIFDRYNFTVKEDEPLEKEVAVDPEMLGKVFENLLEVKDRKSKGTYYTPREIVHYMCQQSLISYLAVELLGKASKDDIEKLVRYGDYFKNDNIDLNDSLKDLPVIITQNYNLIDSKLEDIKICDPAAGSGAFLVGMMGEIVRVRNVLSVYIDDPRRSIYSFKRTCIERSLYGVDIDPGAVEIAKLRLWLSLVVEEEDIKQIKPLPNLDFKIMQGNSLVSEFLGIDFDNWQEKQEVQAQVGFDFENEDDDLIKKFGRKKIDYQNESDKNKKVKLKNEVEDLMIKLFEAKLQREYSELKPIEERAQSILNLKTREEYIKTEKEKFSKKHGFNLENIEKQLREFSIKRKTRPFFPWKLYFAEVFEKGGFDIVIANPPYVSFGLRGVSKMSAEDKNNIKKLFPESAEYKISLYALFMNKAIQLSRDNGVQTFIVPDSFLVGRYFSKIRKLILKEDKILQFLMLPYGVFDATVGFSMVYVFQKSKNNRSENEVKVNTVLAQNNLSANILNNFSYKQSYFEKTKYNRFRLFFAEEEMNLIGKIDLGSEELGESYTGRTGVRSKIGQKNIISDKKEKDTYKKALISGGQIKLYCIRYKDDWINIDPKLLNSGGWDFNVINNPKILIRQTGDSLIASIDEDKYYHLNNIHSFAPKETGDIYLGYLLAILNSKLMNFYYQKTTLEVGRPMAQTDIETIESLPIKHINEIKQKPLIEIVDKILEITKSSDYLESSAKKEEVKEYKKQIDQMVYKLYDLTPEEIEIVEHSCKK